MLELSGKCMEVCTQLSYPPRLYLGRHGLVPLLPHDARANRQPSEGCANSLASPLVLW